MLAGLEVVETLEQHGVATRHPIAVAFFTDEEGSRFAPDMLGSLVFVGGMPLEEALDVRAVDDGARLGDELARIGYAGPVPCPTARPPHAYVELHIEQGPILEDEGVDDRRRRGRAGHLVDRGDDHRPLGPRRHDADAACAATPATSRRRSPSFARRLAVEMGGAQVATVGRLEVRPDLVNVVPNGATLTVDLRNTDDAVLQEAERRLADAESSGSPPPRA